MQQVRKTFLERRRVVNRAARGGGRGVEKEGNGRVMHDGRRFKRIENKDLLRRVPRVGPGN